MGAPSYTTCVQPKDYQDPGLPSGGFFQGLGQVIAEGGFDLLLRICDYVLGGKLVCLGGEQCAIGRVASIETVDDKSGFDKLDNDYSLNLALCPDPLSFVQPGIAHRKSNYLAAMANIQGVLLAPAADTPAPREARSAEKITDNFDGNYVKIHTILELNSPIPQDIQNEDDATTWHVPVLHCEIEGDRAHMVCLAAQGLWGPLHSTVCKIPLIGGFLCTIISILAAPFVGIALAILGTAWVAGSDDNRDYDGGGDLNPNDLVLIRGRWVFDAGHSGWNELHPVLHIQRIPDPAGCQSDGFSDLRDRWCAEVAKLPATVGQRGQGLEKQTPAQQATYQAQIRPENRWFFHPAVDCCRPAAEPDPGPR